MKSTKVMEIEARMFRLERKGLGCPSGVLASGDLRPVRRRHHLRFGSSCPPALFQLDLVPAYYDIVLR